MADLLSSVSEIPTRVATEREVKLAAWPGFELPPLEGVLEGVHATEPQAQRLVAIYWDTHDLRLIRRRVTLRKRSGEGVEKWTLRLPQESDGGIGAKRAEYDFLVAGDGVPAGVTRLLRAWVRSAALQPVAQLETVRRSSSLLDSAGDTVAEVGDNEVSILDEDHVAARFREVEVSLVSDSVPGLLQAVVDRLVEAGAGSLDTVPKLVRALGPRAMKPPELAPVGHGGPSPGEGAAKDAKRSNPWRRAAVADIVRKSVAEAANRLLEHHHVVVLDDDPEGVHQARVGARRLRSLLRLFRPLLEASEAAGLEAELQWLGHELGRVRDLDVQSERLAAHRNDLVDIDDLVALRQLVRRMGAQRAEAQASLIESLDSERTVALYERVVAFASAPPLDSPEAGEAAADVVPKLVWSMWKGLRKVGRQSGPDPTDEQLHDLRLRVKRCRYAVDTAQEVVGGRAKATAAALASAQDVLGEHNEAVVAQQWLRAAHGDASAPEAFVAGRLTEVERRAADRARSRWSALWADLSSPSLWDWAK